MSEQGGRWRLIGLTVADGATQMALDEALLEAVAAGRAPPTVRLYHWPAPWLSLGAGQRSDDLDLAAGPARHLTVVRRPSGGTAVLHDLAQLGYSLALPAGHPLAPADVVESYRRVNELLLTALAALGVRARLAGVAEARAQARALEGALRAACLAALSPYEIVLHDGRKLVGSAQVRRRGGALHQGVLPLRFDPAPTAAMLRTGDRAALRAALATTVGDLETATGRHLTVPDVAAALQSALARALGPGAQIGALTPAEWEAAARWRAERYASPEWTLRR